MSASKVKAKNITFLWFPGFSVRTRYFTKGDILPSFGNTRYDGVWGEMKWFYNANGAWDIRISQLQGAKIRHDYDYLMGNSGDGHSLITYDTNLGSFTGSVRHNQRIGDSTRLGGNFDLRQTSTLASGSSLSQTAAFNLSRNVGRSRLTASFNTTTTTTTETRSNRNGNLTMSHDLWGDRSNQARVQVSGRYSSFDQGQLGRNDELNAHAELSQPTDFADFDLLFDRRFDLDGDAFLGDDSFSSIDRLPELVTAVDFRDWGLEAFSARGKLSVGRILENPNSIDRTRLGVDLSGNIRPIRNLINNTEITFRTDFTQRITGADEAIYALGTQASARTKIHDYADFDASWSWRHFNGFTPFRSDYSTKQHSVRGGLNIRPDRHTRINMSTALEPVCQRRL